MARARNIKPGFFKNELIADLPMFTRLLFIGLWCIADREGRFEDRPKRVKMELFPADDVNVDDALSDLEKSGFLFRYEVEGEKYVQIANFTKHQVPHHKEVASEIPAPPGFRQVTKHAYEVTSKTRAEVFSRDGLRCLKCGSSNDLSIDHIVPLSMGGDNDIENLQTLCKACNSSKGGATKDYRKSNAGSTLSQRCRNDSDSCRTDSLIPDSLIPEVEANASVGSVPPSGPQPTSGVCPADAIVALYHELLPDNPRCKVLSDARRSAIRARWKEAARLTCKPFGYSNRADGLAAWRKFFEICAESDFLTGRATPLPGRPAFVADIDFLMSPSGFAKTLENKYHREVGEAA